MKVILLQDVSELGNVGQIVEVARGHARNYLLPKKLAVKANPRNVKAIEHQKRLLKQAANKNLHESVRMADQFNSLSLTLTRKAGDQDKLFGSVTDMDIEKALSEKGYLVNRKMILLDEPIKTLGVFHVPVKLHQDVEAKIKVWVIKE